MKIIRSKDYIFIRLTLLFAGLSFTASCNNIIEFESIAPCGVNERSRSVRDWSSVDGLVRFDATRSEYFIVARHPEDKNLSVLRTCNIPAEFRVDRTPIRFFGNEMETIFPEIVMEDDKIAYILPFEITYLERVVKK
jgi:hypothetical protein